MASRYIIYHLDNITGQRNEIEILSSDYENIKEAKTKLQSALYFEEKFNYIVDNYIELEREILKICLNKMVFPIYTKDFNLYVEEIHLLNRRIINLLTTCRQYLDQIPHDFKIIFAAEPKIKEIIKDIKSVQYDKVIGYRIMEALRNYVQHRGFPSHLLQHKMTADNGTSMNRHKIDFVLRVEDLREDNKFNKKVLDELKNIGERVHLKLYLRQYVYSLYDIHKNLRDILELDITKWKNQVIYTFNLFEEKYGKIDYLTVARIYNAKIQNPKDRFFIMRDILERLEWLIEKNELHSNLESHFITSE